MFTKKMTALMVLVAMLVAGASFAGDMDYTVYGKMHTSVNYLSDSDESQLGLSSNTSRFGIKGSKELNNDMSLIWQFENSINIAQKGSDTLAKRNSFIGMSSEYGTALFGIHDTPFKMIGRKATFFKDTIGDFRSTTFGWDLRLQDVAAYISPDFDGFGFIAAYMFDQAAMGAEEAATAYSVAAHYAKDALYVGGAMEQWSEGVTGLIPVGEDMIMGEAQTGLRFVAKYDFGQFALAGLFQTVSNFRGYEDASAQTMGLEAKFKASDLYCVKGSYYMADPDTDADDDDFAQLALGVDRNLGNNSMIYVQYATVMNADGAMWGLGGTADYGNGFGDMVGASDAGESPMGFSLGWVTTWK